MFFAQTSSGVSLILLGLSILAGAFLLRRSIVLVRRSRERDASAELRHERQTAEQTGSSLLRQLEVRLYDYGREVEGRIQTRMAVLDELVLRADREIARLHQLLERPEPTGSASTMKRGPDIVGPTLPMRRESYDAGGTGFETLRRPGADSAGPSLHSDPVTRRERLTPPEKHMLLSLLRAGHSPADIARLTGRPIAEIEEITRAEQRPGKEAA